MPFRPQSRQNAQHPDLKHLQVNGAPNSGPDAVSKLETLVSESENLGNGTVVVENGVH